MSAGLGLDGFLLKTVKIPHTKSDGRQLWRWEHVYAGPLSWNRVADLRGLAYVMVTSPDREIIDYWDKDDLNDSEVQDVRVSNLESYNKRRGSVSTAPSQDARALIRANRSSIYSFDTRNGMADPEDSPRSKSI